MTTARVAVAQGGSVLFDTPATLERLGRLATQARDAGAAIVLFPEAFVGGYPKGLDFGARVGSRTPAGHECYRRYFAGAIDVPGEETARIGEIAQSLGLEIVVGVIERQSGSLYCTVLFFDAAGGLVAKHRKLMPTAMERLVWAQGDGSTIPVVDTAAGRAGAVICWENYMPLLRTAMYHQGIELYCAPTVDDRERWVASMRHIALEGRCFVLSACQYFMHEDMPADLHASVPDDGMPLIRGGSCIVHPTGELLAGPVYDAEAILVADIDRDDLIRAKFDFDVVGHYARPDVFALHVDTAARTSVVIDPATRP